MSAALETLNDEDKRLLEQMQRNDAASEPAPEPAQDAPADTPPPPAETPKPEPTTLVPQKALHEERERRKEAERRARELEQNYARVDERLKLLMGATQAASQAPEATAAAAASEPAPDPSADPLGYVRHVTTDMQRQIAALSQRVQKSEGLERQVAEQQLQQTQGHEMLMWGQGQEHEFATETPDYRKAAEFLRDARMRQYAAMGVTNPAVAQSLLGNDLMGLAQNARQNGLQFGKMLYDLALASGYQRAADTPVATTTAPPTPEQRVATATRGAEMSTGLGAAGTAPRGEMSADYLASLSDAQFAALYEKSRKNPDWMRQYFGS